MSNAHREMITDFYDNNAEELCGNYNAVSALNIYTPIMHLLPVSPSKILDIGCGSGRDAAWFTSNHHIVTAVDNSANMLALAKKEYGNYPIEWIHDNLPNLEHVNNRKFDIILLNAVWMHLSEEDRQKSYFTLSNLLEDNGTLLISLRLGPLDMRRPMFKLEAEKEIEMATKVFSSAEILPMAEDQLKRGDVEWKMLKLNK